MLKVNVQIFNGSQKGHSQLQFIFVCRQLLFSILRNNTFGKRIDCMAAIFFLEFESSIMYFIVFNRLIQNLYAIADLIVNKIHNNQIDIYSKSV